MKPVAWLIPFLAVSASGCRGPQPPPFKPVADVKQLMLMVVDPAGDAIWDATGTISTAAGVFDRAPKTQADWDAVRNGAMVVAESGNLLMMVPRAKDNDAWMKASQALVEIGITALAAADAKDVKRVFDVGADMHDVCENCHERYMENYR